MSGDPRSDPSGRERRPKHHEPDGTGPRRPGREFELPEDLRDRQRRATRLEWITLGYLLSATSCCS